MKRETIIEGDKWRGREEKVSYAALFSVVVLREDLRGSKKNGLGGRLGRKRKYIMTEYLPQISLSLKALGNVYWSANLLNLLTNQAQNDLHIIKQLKAVGQKSDKFADIMLVHVNCHSFRSRLLSLQTHRH